MTPDRSPKQAAVRACELCGQAWPTDTYQPPPWCEACERANLRCVSMMVCKDRDRWRVEFWPCDRAMQFGRTRKYQLEESLFRIVLRSYDPAGPLTRLSWVMYRNDPPRGCVSLRLTMEQVQALQE